VTQPRSVPFQQKAGPSAAPQDDNSEVVSSSPRFVQGMGLFSATAIVMGSMIGSGIFIVPAEMSRVLGSPALLIAAWLVTAAMTLIGALSYGELAAMMPKAGGQYVYLRESLGPLSGFLYGWTLFVVIQTGTIAAVGVAFGKFLGVFFPSVSASHWLWHIGHVPPWPVGPMVLGNMDIGLNTANLAAIVVITLLTAANTRGIRLGSAVQNVFTTAKVLALLAVIAVGFVAKNAVAVAANFGVGWHAFFANSGWHTWHQVQVGVGGPIQYVGIFTVIAVVQVGSLFSSDAWNNVTFTAGEIRNPKRNLPLSLALGTALHRVQLCVPERAADGGSGRSRDAGGAGDSVCVAGPCGHGGDGSGVWGDRREADGGGNFGVDVWVRQWNAAGRGAGVLRDEPGWLVLQERR